MVITNTKKAAERRLLAITPTLPTAFENVNFDPPATIYQRVQFVIQPPDDPVLGTGYYRERIQMQVFVVDKANVGTGSAIERAEIIRSTFPKGLVLTEASTRIHILRTPQIAGSVFANGRLVVPVLIDLVSEVYTA